MPSAKVKSKLEAAAKASKVSGATTAEAQAALGTWKSAIEDPEAAQDLKALATLRVREVEAAISLGSAAALERALGSLAATATANT